MESEASERELWQLEEERREEAEEPLLFVPTAHFMASAQVVEYGTHLSLLSDPLW